MTVQLLNNPPINQTIKPNTEIYQNQNLQGMSPNIQNGYNIQTNSAASAPPPPAGCGANLNVSA